MENEIQQSIIEVIQAIENLNRAFEKYADHLRKAGNVKELEQRSAAARVPPQKLLLDKFKGPVINQIIKFLPCLHSGKKVLLRSGLF